MANLRLLLCFNIALKTTLGGGSWSWRYIGCLKPATVFGFVSCVYKNQGKLSTRPSVCSDSRTYCSYNDVAEVWLVVSTVLATDFVKTHRSTWMKTKLLEKKTNWLFGLKRKNFGCHVNYTSFFASCAARLRCLPGPAGIFACERSAPEQWFTRRLHATSRQGFLFFLSRTTWWCWRTCTATTAPTCSTSLSTCSFPWSKLCGDLSGGPITSPTSRALCKKGSLRCLRLRVVLIFPTLLCVARRDESRPKSVAHRPRRERAATRAVPNKRNKFVYIAASVSGERTTI